ncbi:hypothetical protein RJT34_24536 [Clitoria ternatea]|uniref:Uncharacterized protein n=1 Tax=Clitoria ternatea TaxID=43366 RepID=A0AAN9FWJ1_CLITE
MGELILIGKKSEGTLAQTNMLKRGDEHGPSSKARVMQSLLSLNGTVTTRDGRSQTNSRNARSVKPSQHTFSQRPTLFP